MAKKVSQRIKHSARYAAMQALERVDKGGAYSNLLLNEMMQQAQLSDKDGRLLTEIVYGTLSRQRLLDFYLAPYVQKAKKIDSWVQNLLRLSSYQLIYLDKVPDHAVINEAVEIAKQHGNPGIGKFVNGVLRNFLRQPLRTLTDVKDPLEQLAIEISMPVWLTEKLVQQIGLEETRALGYSLFERSKASARVDLRVCDREQALADLVAQGLEAVASDVSPYGVVAEKGFLAGTDLFKQGVLTIQDESSMLVAPTLRVEPHHQVLDACAAPGGKTAHIATFLDSKQGGKITALDIHAHKLKLVQENVQRLHVAEVVETCQLDARHVHERFAPEQFDRILVDAPCSGLGLMRRKPDIKYNKKPTDFEQLPDIQLAILTSVAPTLKVNGMMVYSTCTVATEENQAVIAAFLEAHPEFQKIELLANDLVQQAVTDQMLTLYPHKFKTDGFFICCLQKVR